MREAFDWDAALVRRQLRLGNLLAMNAPAFIIERETQLYRKAVHHSGDFGLIWRDLKWAVSWKFDALQLDARTWWLRLWGATDEEIEAILFPYEGET